MPHSSSQEEIVRLLKRGGPQTARELAQALGVSTVAAHKHLDVLATRGLVAVVVRRQRIGRPAHVYQLTERAEGLFPQGYEQLALELLEDICALAGEATVAQLLAARRARLQQDYAARLANKELGEKVRELARLREESGYLVSVEEQHGTYTLHHHHCPIQAVARRYCQACQEERDLYAALLGTCVERRPDGAAGERNCSFQVGGQPEQAAS